MSSVPQYVGLRAPILGVTACASVAAAWGAAPLPSYFALERTETPRGVDLSTLKYCVGNIPDGVACGLQTLVAIEPLDLPHGVGGVFSVLQNRPMLRPRLLSCNVSRSIALQNTKSTLHEVTLHIL